MESERRRQIVLVALAVVLGFVVYRAWTGQSGVPLVSSRQTASAALATQPAAVPAAPDVHLRSLESERPKPGATERNLFQFKTKPAPPPPRPAGLASTGPPLPPPIPTIALKFIGVVERPERAEKIAVLRDPAGRLFSGHEGGVVGGRFRILRIGAESIEMAYLDGQGRQTIRLTGS